MVTRVRAGGARVLTLLGNATAGGTALRNTYGGMTDGTGCGGNRTGVFASQALRALRQIQLSEVIDVEEPQGCCPA